MLLNVCTFKLGRADKNIIKVYYYPVDSKRLSITR